MNKTLVACIVRAAGEIDLTATKAKYQAVLLDGNVKKLGEYDKKLSAEMTEAVASFDKDMAEYVEVRATWDEKAAAAVTAIFEKYGKVNNSGTIVKPVLISMAAQYLLNSEQITFDSLKLAESMIAAYISDNAGTLYSIEKGKDGGIRPLKS